MVRRYVNIWIAKIEDVTERIHMIKAAVGGQSKQLPVIPEEHAYEVSEAIRCILGMSYGVE